MSKKYVVHIFRQIDIDGDWEIHENSLYSSLYVRFNDGSVKLMEKELKDILINHFSLQSEKYFISFSPESFDFICLYTNPETHKLARLLYL